MQFNLSILHILLIVSQAMGLPITPVRRQYKTPTLAKRIPLLRLFKIKPKVPSAAPKPKVVTPPPAKAANTLVDPPPKLIIPNKPLPVPPSTNKLPDNLASTRKKPLPPDPPTKPTAPKPADSTPNQSSKPKDTPTNADAEPKPATQAKPADAEAPPKKVDDSGGDNKKPSDNSGGPDSTPPNQSSKPKDTPTSADAEPKPANQAKPADAETPPKKVDDSGGGNKKPSDNSGGPDSTPPKSGDTKNSANKDDASAKKGEEGSDAKGTPEKKPMSLMAKVGIGAGVLGGAYLLFNSGGGDLMPGECLVGESPHLPAGTLEDLATKVGNNDNPEDIEDLTKGISKNELEEYQGIFCNAPLTEQERQQVEAVLATAIIREPREGALTISEEIRFVSELSQLKDGEKDKRLNEILGRYQGELSDQEMVLLQRGCDNDTETLTLEDFDHPPSQPQDSGENEGN